MKRNEFRGGFLGSDVTVAENPFLSDDISGKQNRILSAVKDSSNVLFYRGDPPTMHVVGNDAPTVLNIKQRNLTQIPVLPSTVRVLVIRENALKSLEAISGYPSLEVVEASANLVEEISLNPPPPNLRALVAASNSITRIAASDIFMRLEVLNLSGNRLTEFDFGLFPAIKTLNLSFNAFKRFEVSCASIVELSIQNNVLTEFEIVNARSMSHLDLSSNQLTDITFVEKMPSLTHLTGMSNKFIDIWASIAVNAAPLLRNVNGRHLREGEIAIHKDRVAKFVKSTKAPHPHQEISNIRLAFRRLKNVVVPQTETTESVENIWIGRSLDRVTRAKIVAKEAEQLRCVSTLSDDGCLTVYGAVTSNEFMRVNFSTLKLQYVPVIRGSETEKRVSELAGKGPTMLTLDHNLLGVAEDLMFLTEFMSVRVLQIEGNPVMKGTLFRPLVSYLMPMLQVVNGQQITLAEKKAGIAHFRHLLIMTKGIDIETGLPPEEEEDWE